MCCGVYAIRNKLNGKLYIGSTGKSFSIYLKTVARRKELVQLN